MNGLLLLVDPAATNRADTKTEQHQEISNCRHFRTRPKRTEQERKSQRRGMPTKMRVKYRPFSVVIIVVVLRAVSSNARAILNIAGT